MRVAGKPDFTAWFVLQGLLVAMCQPRFKPLRDEATFKLCNMLARAAGDTRMLYRFIYSLPYNFQYQIGEFVTNPGRIRHYFLRKREIETNIRKLLDSGTKQIIALGAGLDVLCLRLAPEYPHVRFIEIDRGGSQQFKANAIQAGGVKLPENIEFIDGDLREPLPFILKASKFFNSGEATAWIAEGLFMFIPENGVVRMFEDMGKLSPSRSHLIFTSIPVKKHGSALGRHIQEIYLKKEKSPFEWMIEFNKVPSFLANLRYGLVSQTECDTLHKRYMGEEFMVNSSFGEDIHVATTP